MKKLTQLVLAGAAMSLALTAQAETKVVTSNTIFDLENHPGALTFDRFDSTLGTLQSVQIDLHSDVTGKTFAENKSGVAGDFTVSVGGILTLTVNALHTLNSNAMVSQTLSLSAYDGLVNFGGTSGTISPFGPVQFVGSAIYSDGATLSGLSGNGQFSTSLTDVFKTAGGGNVVYAGSAKVNAYATVTYNYEVTAVPEPETYGMLLAGLGLLGVVARKRKSA